MNNHSQHTDHKQMVKEAEPTQHDHGKMDHGQMDHGGDGHDDHKGHTDHTGHELMFRDRFFISLVLSVPVLLYSPTIQGWLNYTAPTFFGSWLILPLFSTIIFFYGGLPFLSMAKVEIGNRAPGMMTLISLAISVAYFYSMGTLVADIGDDFFWELVTLIDVMLLGHWIEMRSIRQASGALGALAKLMPDTAEMIMPDGEVMEHPASDLNAGDIFLVRPGSSVPADGEVVDGSSDVNEAMITGESKAIRKQVGDSMIAGTVNAGDSSLRVMVTAVGGDTMLSGIMRLVEEAQQSKSQTQLLADRAAALLFYLAVTSAVVTAIIWTIVEGGMTAGVIARVVTVLVIACPHALGLAVPLVVSNTTALAADNGILIRDRQAMENARNLTIIAFDKTGTLTKGEVGVVNMLAADGVELNEVLAITAALERDSEHPIAKSIRAKAEERAVTIPAIADFKILKGRGVQATIDGAMMYVGGPQLLSFLDGKRPSTFVDFAQEAGAKGESVIYLVDGETAVAAFALADVVRPESHQAITTLHEMGVEVAMLTGDSEDVARTVAQELNIDRYFAQVLPADKDKKVIALQGQGKFVGMVGDGVNDAPALTRADVGIAIGGGTDVAIESADLILVKSNPLDIVKLIKLSRASYRKQTQNIWWGAGYNLLMIPLAAGILAPWGIVPSPAVGAFLMSISTIIVAINAQLLRKVDLA